MIATSLGHHFSKITSVKHVVCVICFTCVSVLQHRIKHVAWILGACVVTEKFKRWFLEVTTAGHEGTWAGDVRGSSIRTRCNKNRSPGSLPSGVVGISLWGFPQEQERGWAAVPAQAPRGGSRHSPMGSCAPAKAVFRLFSFVIGNS